MSREECSGYSLVMSGFQGKYGEFQEAAEQAFSRQGIYAYSLCRMRESLPAEIASGLNRESAERIRSVLEATGASLTVLESQQVQGVRYHAEDCWAHRCAGHWCYCEIEGLVVRASLNVGANILLIKERRPEALPWQIEAAINHEHPTHHYSRHALSRAREMGAEMAKALRIAYPERRFIVDYLEEQVSFYQYANGALLEDVPPTNPLPELAYCEMCKGRRPYRLRSEPDGEFPKADWGDCLACESEILLRTWRVREAV